MAFNSVHLVFVVLNVVTISLFVYLAKEASKSENDLLNGHNGTKKQLEQKDAQKATNIKTPELLIASPTISPAAYGTPTSSLTGTFTGTTEFQVEQPKNGLKTRAVIHMGVHKTGSTTIQHASREYQESLKKDGYKMPWVGFTEHWGFKLRPNENQVPFAACFVEPHDNRCVPEILQEGTYIARRRKNIFVSTELFSKLETNGIKKLLTYLNKRWDLVTIIVYYRRYYDYLCSVYGQTHKKRRLIDVDLWETSLLDFLLDEIDHGPLPHYTFPLISRLKQHLDNTKNNTNVVVMNFHDRSMDLSERFYCEAIPGAYRTCEAIRKSQTSIRANSAVYLGYANLAYAACKANLVHASTKAKRNALTAAVMKHQEETLGLTRDDFKLKCLSPDTLQRLLSKSLEYEKAVLPELDGSDLIADFEKQAVSKLCIIDVDFTLGRPEWKDFLKNYTY